ncbi:MAG: hypothetical protein RSB91_00055 [Clostridia bacterium]
MAMQWISTMSDAVAAAVTQAPVSSGLVALPLFTKGILTTVIGLLGVFLVLALFFGMIKLMQFIKPKQES